MIRIVVIAVCSVSMFSCGGSSSQVELKGSPGSIIKLEGEWTGKYVGVDSGREGTIRFDLTASRHTADGEVVMFPGGDTGKGTPLQVRFVEVEKDGSVSGRIDPYTDPQCKCAVVTEFSGTMQGDTIEGTFTTKAMDSARTQTGRWSVQRSNGAR